MCAWKLTTWSSYSQTHTAGGGVSECFQVEILVSTYTTTKTPQRAFGWEEVPY